MTKTPEELALEYADLAKDLDIKWFRELEANAFLAGYETAQKQYEARIKELEQAIIQSVDAMAGVKYDDENT